MFQLPLCEHSSSCALVLRGVFGCSATTLVRSPQISPRNRVFVGFYPLRLGTSPWSPVQTLGAVSCEMGFCVLYENNNAFIHRSRLPLHPVPGVPRVTSAVICILITPSQFPGERGCFCPSHPPSSAGDGDLQPTPRRAVPSCSSTH